MLKCQVLGILLLALKLAAFSICICFQSITMTEMRSTNNSCVGMECVRVLAPIRWCQWGRSLEGAWFDGLGRNGEQSHQRKLPPLRWQPCPRLWSCFSHEPHPPSPTALWCLPFCFSASWIHSLLTQRCF